MKFKAINKSSVEANNNFVHSATITLQENSLYFSHYATVKFKMIDKTGEGKYIKLVQGLNIDDKPNGYWYIIVTDKVTDAFKCTIDKRKQHGGVRLTSRALINLLKASIPKNVKGRKFYLQETNHTLEGCSLIEILLNKSVEEILKNQ